MACRQDCAKASYGGSASPEIMAEIEKCVRPLEESGRTFLRVTGGAVEYFAPQASYLGHVKAMLEEKTLAGFKRKSYLMSCMARQAVTQMNSRNNMD